MCPLGQFCAILYQSAIRGINWDTRSGVSIFWLDGLTPSYLTFLTIIDHYWPQQLILDEQRNYYAMFATYFIVRYKLQFVMCFYIIVQNWLYIVKNNHNWTHSYNKSYCDILISVWLHSNCLAHRSQYDKTWSNLTTLTKCRSNAEANTAIMDHISSFTAHMGILHATLDLIGSI